MLPTPIRRRGERPAIVTEVRPHDLSMYGAAGLDAVAGRARGFFAGLEAPVRLLCLSEPFSAEPALENVGDQIVACGPGEEWRRSGLSAYRKFLEHLTQEADLRATRYFLTTWPGPELPPQAITRAAQDSFNTDVKILDRGLPPIFYGGYRDADTGDHLVPREKGNPHMAIYTAYELLGTWDLYTLHQLLLMAFPVAVAIDIKTYGPDKAQFTLQNAYNNLYAQINQQGKVGGKDAKSEQAFHDIQHTLKCVETGERFHEVRIAVLIKAASRGLLREYGAYIKNTTASKLRLRLEIGQQSEALKYFTSTPTAQIGVDMRSMPLLSGGAGIMVAGPFGLRSRTETGGILYGLDKTNGNPVFVNVFAQLGSEGRTAGHCAILGRTGAGKTFLAQCLLHRLCLTGVQVIVLEPVGHFKRLAESLGKGGSYNQIAWDKAAVNPLDVVMPTIAGQIDHVTRQLGLLLSCGSGAAASGKDIGRKTFTNAELGALDEALRELYEPLWERTPTGGSQAWHKNLTAQTMPRLDGLCARLADMVLDDGSVDPAAHELGGEIDRLFVRGVHAATFNAATNIDLSLTARAVAFDFSGVDESYLPWFYAQILAAMGTHLRNRDRGYPVVVCVDEFGVMARDPVLANQMWRLTKTGRTYGVAVWTMDQNPSSYGTEDARQMISNAPYKLIGRQEADDVETDRRLFPRLTEGHVQQMLTGGRGEFIAILDDDYYPIQVVPSPLELGYFAGT